MRTHYQHLFTTYIDQLSVRYHTSQFLRDLTLYSPFPCYHFNCIIHVRDIWRLQNAYCNTFPLTFRMCYIFQVAQTQRFRTIARQLTQIGVVMLTHATDPPVFSFQSMVCRFMGCQRDRMLSNYHREKRSTSRCPHTRRILRGSTTCTGI